MRIHGAAGRPFADGQLRRGCPALHRSLQSFLAPQVTPILFHYFSFTSYLTWLPAGAAPRFRAALDIDAHIFYGHGQQGTRL